MDRIPFLISELEATRSYTLRILDQCAPEIWYKAPAGAPTHIAWQVGHLAIAQYNHFVQRIAGETEADKTVIDTARYFVLFNKGTTPEDRPELYPPREQLLADLATMLAHGKKLLAAQTDASLDLPVRQPHQIVKTRYESAMWMIKHEFIHVGQIGLLRRLHGLTPWR